MLEFHLGAEGGQVEAVGVAQGQLALVVLEREVAGVGAAVEQAAVAAQVAVVGRVDGVVARVVAKLEREQRRGAPRNVGVDVDLVAQRRQVREAAPTHRAQVRLRPRRQVHVPGQQQFYVRGAAFLQLGPS